MKKHFKILTVIVLLAAAGMPAMCHAMGDKDKAPADQKAAENEPTKNAVMASPIPPGAPATFADLAHDLLPAVVNVSSTIKAGSATMEEEGMGSEGEQDQQQMPMPQFPPGSPFEDLFKQFFDQRGQQAQQMPATSLGSGFVIDAAKGYIVTNNHVVKDADEVRVTFGDDTTLPAKIIGKDEKMDLAVLQVKTDKKLAEVHFGDSDKMRVGDWVVAIGNPFGLGGTVTAGIVSAQQRNINAGPYDDFIQTDASINRGNSGGPMFDLQGEVIGINTAIFSPSGGSVGIGFAIPSNLAKPVVTQLIEFGKTRRGWIGVRIQAVTDEIAEGLGLAKTQGALVASVTPKGPAEDAKLKTGDVILEFDGKAITSMHSLPRIVAETPIGKTVEMKLWRDNKETTAKIKVAELEKAEADGLLDDEAATEGTDQPAPSGTKLDKLGMTLGSLGDMARKQYNIPDDVEGVVVQSVSPTGEAAMKGVMAGDVIVEIAQEKAQSPQAVADAVAKAQKAGKSSILLLMNRGGDARFVALKLTEKK